MSRFLLILWFGLLTAAAAMAQTVDPDRLGELSEAQEKQAEQAKALQENRDAVRRDITKLKRQLTQLAQDARKIERENNDIARRLERLEIQKTNVENSIYGDRKSLTRLLGALQRIGNNPPPALAVSPDDVVKAAQAGKLMASISTRLKTRTQTLEKQLVELETVRLEIDEDKNKLAINEKALESKRGYIKSVVTEKSKLERSISADQARAKKRAAALAAEANTLRDLIRQFEQAAEDVFPRLKPKPGDSSRPPPSRPKLSARSASPSAPLKFPRGTPKFSDSKNKLRAPVSGRLSKTYSPTRKGITVTTAKKAQIVAPAASRVEFAGPFKNYESVVILNVGDGYFILLTGVGEIYVDTGEMLRPGEPIGLMPFNTNTAAELYIEFRKNGTTVNPMPWFGTTFARR